LALASFTLTPELRAQAGLVAAYSLNEGSGTTVHDSSGNGLNGTALNTTWVPGKYGDALSFNGTSTNVDLGTAAAFAMTGSMTLEAWAYVGAQESTDEEIIALSNDTLGWQLKATNDTGPWTFGIGVSNGTSHVQRYSSTALALDTWYHVAGVYNASAQTLDIYVNGVLADGTLKGTVPSSQVPASGVHTYLGQRGPACYCYFDGTIDEVRVYNVPLTQAQIQTDMNTPIGPAAPVLSLTGASSTQIGLSWTVPADPSGIAHYVLQRCTGSSCTNFTTLAPSLTTTTYTDTAVTMGQAYNYIVYAVDNATISGPDSNVVDATALTVQPPTAPTNVTAAAFGTIAEIRVGWTASTSSVGVAKYVIERCSGPSCTNFTQIGTTTATYYKDTAVQGSTTYSYIVAAVDNSSNLGPYSTPPATATTIAIRTTITIIQGNYSDPAGVQPSVTVPFKKAQKAGDLIVVAVGWNDTTATVNSITDTVGNVYILAVGPTNVPTVSTQSIYYAANIKAAAAGANSVTVAFSGAGANYPDIRILEYMGADPNTPVDVTSFGTGTSLTSITNPVTTTNATDLLFGANIVQTATSVAGPDYTKLFITSPDADIVEDLMVTSTGSYTASAALTTLQPAGTWIMQMVAFRTQIPGGAGGVTPPTQPVLSGSAISTTQINLSWTASTSSIGIQDYVLQRCSGVGCSNFATISTQTATTYNDTMLMPGTSYSYIVTAYDTQNNASPNSNTFTTSTVSAGGPTTPTNVTPTPVSTTQINLIWTASTSPNGIKNYVVERCAGAGCTNFAQVATPTTASYNDTPLSPGTTYVYQVGAVDNLNNASAFSTPPASATTLGPSTPGNLQATPVSTTQINLTWIASTSSAGIKNYVLQRCSGLNCTVFNTIASPTTNSYNDTPLTADTPYSYQVSAVDNSNYTSAESNVATTTTLQNTTAGLVGAYGFDEGTGTLTYDASGNGFTGTLNGGVTWTTSGKYGDALVFDGASGFVDLGAPAQYGSTGSMSWEAWVYPTTLPQGSGSLSDDMILALADDAAGWELKLTNDPGTNAFAIAVDSGSHRIQRYSRTVVQANTWYHVAGVYNASAQTLDIYTNGVLDDGTVSGTVPSAQVIPSGVDAYVGQRLTGSYNQGGFFFGGTIDEVRIYDSAITATQIQSDMATPVGPGTHPAVTFNQTSLNFSTQVINTSSSQQTVMLSNSGGAPLTITSIAVTESGPLSYSQTNTCPATLTVGQQCPIHVVFTPGATGPLPANITVVDNAPGSPHTLPLTGTGLLTPSGILVSPRYIPLTAGKTEQFYAYNTTGTVTWAVDGAPGGSSTNGTISANGLYTAPATVSTQTTHTVTATANSAVASATVYLVNWTGTFMRDVDTMRTGLNPKEVVLTPSNVTSTSFGKVFSYPIDGNADASPLYAPGINIGGTAHNVVYVATEHDSVYAFDADGSQTTPLWHTSFINPSAGITSVPATDVGPCLDNVCDIGPEIGITGSPVIDPSTNTLYVVAKTKEVQTAQIYYHRLHALDLTTGAEKFGGPIILSASVAGNGAGSSGGQVAFNSLRENQRPALLLNNGVVYIAFASHNDYVPYHGWILGYKAAQGLQQTLVFNTSPNATSFGVGIWMSGDGLATDSTGNLFFATGNGIFDANTGGVDYGDSLMSINPTNGNVLTYFTPSDQSNDSANDLDLGSGGVLLLPSSAGSSAHPNLALTAGKDGTVYLVDRANMGGYNSNTNNVVQTLQNEFPGGTFHTGNFKAPVWWNGNIYYSADADYVRSFTVSNATIAPGNHSNLVFQYPGGTLGVSANGNSTPILWAIQRNDLDPIGNGTVAPGILHAFDATNVATELYNSNQAGTRDMLDLVNKWSAPLAANGRIYVASEGFLTAFGLLP
jgi:fibronectin type 3 domain-containing protein